MNRSAPAISISQFLPVDRAGMQARGWDTLDVLMITGDAYVDHPAFGTPLLARLLESAGYRVGILAQPDWKEPEAFRVMGTPRLCVSISAGAMDSMVNHYTAAKKIRRDDAYTPGGRAGARPNRAVIAYTAAVKGVFKGLPVIIGGIEASLRRLAHYDYWSDQVRRSVLVDSKADLLLFGMAERAILEVVNRLHAGEEIGSIRDIRGTAYLSGEPPGKGTELPTFDEVSSDTDAYNRAFRLAAGATNPFRPETLWQRHGSRVVVVNPPALPMSGEELDRIYALPFQRLPHPSYTEKITAYEQIKFSLTSHRGCFGGCAFCAITHHQGKTIQSRSRRSVAAELEELTRHPEFRGTVSDVGGPTANMYGLGCADAEAQAQCRRESCLYPTPCRHLVTDDAQGVALLRDLKKHPKVKHLFVASGIRFDLLEWQPHYFDDLVEDHVGGLLKVAPESVVPKVTSLMRKPGPESFSRFLKEFWQRAERLGKRYGVVPYFICGHPGTTLADMVEVALFLKRNRLRVEQVQEFTPTPGSLSTCIYHTGIDPMTGNSVYVPRREREIRLQKALLLWHLPAQRQEVLEALREAGREDAALELLGESGRGGSSSAKQQKGGKPTRRADGPKGGPPKRKGRR